LHKSYFFKYNFLNLKIFPVRILALITASLVLFVAIRMGLRFL